MNAIEEANAYLLLCDEEEFFQELDEFHYHSILLLEDFDE